MTKQQRKFTKSLQFELLSEFSTPDEDISHNETTLPNSNSVNVKLESKDPLDYLDTMIYHSTEKDLRYLELYEKKDDKRLRNWLSSDPKNLLEMNVKRFKLLLALNLSGRAEKHGKQFTARQPIIQDIRQTLNQSEISVCPELTNPPNLDH